MKPSELAAWVRAQASQGATRFLLRQVVWTAEGESLSAVAQFDLSADQKGASELAEDAIRQAAEDAADTGGAQRYALLASREKKTIARKVWRVSGERHDDDVQPSEPPNMQGVLALAMRHSDAAARGMMGMAQLVHDAHGSTVLSLERQMGRLEGQVDRMAQREMRVIELVESLSQRTHERSLEHSRADREERTRTAAIEMLGPLVPSLASKMLGLPLAPPESLSALDALVGSITPEQIEGLQRLLNPGQFVALEQLYTQTIERVRAAEARQVAAAAAKPQASAA